MKIVSCFGVDPSDAQKLVEGMYEKSYSLLTGAGVSFGAIGGDGVKLAGAVDLAKEIKSALGLDLDEDDSSDLPLVYGDAVRVRRDKLHGFISSRFAGCRPVWQERLFLFNWKRIWTLNIDDVLESGFSPSEFHERISSYIYTDDFKPRDLQGFDLQIVHLHGWAKKIDKSLSNIIFSVKDYAIHSESRPGWHAEFRSEFSQKPFIICGARLRNEYDLESVINYGNHSRSRGGAPSFVVLPKFRPGEVERFSGNGFLTIEASGEDFFNALLSDVRSYAETANKGSDKYRHGLSEMNSSFRNLAIDSKFRKSSRRGLDYYSAVEAQWEHIVDNCDALLSASGVARDFFLNDESLIKFSIFHGGAVSGKSSAALRVGKMLLELGYKVWLFRGERSFNVNYVFDYLSEERDVLLIFDDCLDFSGAFDELITTGQKMNVKINAVAVCESARLRSLEVDVDGSACKIFSLDPLINKLDFLALFKKRAEKGRLGVLSSSRQDEVGAWKNFKTVFNSRLMEWVEHLESAAQFGEAIRNIVKEKTCGVVQRDLVMLTACIHRFGYSLPYFIADKVRGGVSLEVLLDEGGDLHGLAYLDEKGIRLRSRVFSKKVWGDLPLSDKFECLELVANQLAPLVVPLSISQKSYHYLIVRSIMDWESLKNDLGSRAEEWYGKISGAHGWNARFWEQRALLASDRGRAEEAYSYAKHAISIHGGDSFPYTTLGKICLRIASHRNDLVGVERYWEGVESLGVSTSIASRNGHQWEHPYVTFFLYTLRVVELSVFSDQLEKINSEWTRWMQSAKKNKIILTINRSTYKTLDDFQREWLLRAVKLRAGS